MPYGYYGYYFDPTYILIIIAAIISLIAQWRVNSAFSKYSRVASMSGMTGAQAARMILQSNGINDVSVQRISGKLTDHYNPSTKVLNLSESVYGSTSVAAIGVAAHECGHAIQHARGYFPLSLRTALVPVANIGSQLSWVFIIVGAILSFNQTLIINRYYYVLCWPVLFQLCYCFLWNLTASARALEQLESNGILYRDEVSQTRKVLSAAALTYVAAAATAILQLLRLIILFGGRGRRDD